MKIDCAYDSNSKWYAFANFKAYCRVTFCSTRLGIPIQLAGFKIDRLSTNICEINNFNYRKKKDGIELIQGVLSELAKDDIHKIYCVVDEKYRPAIKLNIGTFGFIKTGQTKSFQDILYKNSGVRVNWLLLEKVLEEA